MGDHGDGAGKIRQGRAQGRWLIVAVLAWALVAVGCATTGATLGSGVGERLLERPPFYAGRMVAGEGIRLAHLPIVYARDGGVGGLFEQETGEGTAVADLLARLNAHLDVIAAGRSEPLPLLPGTPPDVRFTCEQDSLGDCASREVDDVDRRFMYLAVGRPSSEWRASAAEALEGADADHLLSISLEVADYWPRQRNLRGEKEIYLGSGYTVSLPWLTALDRPIQVLQLTAALVDVKGKAVRIGAEGMLARRTGILAGSVGLQALITEDDVARLLEARRSELPGEPLVWEVALENVVAQLVGDGGISLTRPRRRAL